MLAARFSPMFDIEKGPKMYKSIVGLSVFLFGLGLLLPDVGAQDVGLDALSRIQRYEARRESSANPDLAKNSDARSIEPGATLVLGELEGPGIIAHMWCTVNADDLFYGRSLVLRMYWDDNEKPSVIAPLGDFFGVGHGAMVDYSSAVASTSSHGRARNCFWRMPFKKSARVTVTNESEEHRVHSFYFYLDWQKHETLPEDSTYFHAQYRQEHPAREGDYTILETTGQGHYVGTVLSTHMMETGWFGEGDDRFYVDGEELPSLRGTGTEDYFGDAWGFRQFSRPYYGVSLWEGYYAGDRVTAYRWHVPDPVPFTKSLKVTIEHRGSVMRDTGLFLEGFVERQDWVSSVAYWYQDTPRRLPAELPPLETRLPPYRGLNMEEDVTLRAEPSGFYQRNARGFTYLPNTPDAWVEIEFEMEEPGRYLVNAFLQHGFFSGVYQAFMDGTKLGGPIDLYAEGGDPVWTRLHQHDFEPGKHVLRFEGRGPSPNLRAEAPNQLGLVVEYLNLLRLQDMAGYKEAMERILEEREED